MRKTTLLIAAAGAAIAMPAAAQVSVDADAQTQVDPGTVVGDTATTLDRTVQDTAQATQDTLDDTAQEAKMVAATRAQVHEGVAVKDSTGAPIGAVTSVDADVVTVSDGEASYRVPMAALFADSEGTVEALYLGATKAELQAAAGADASAEVDPGDGM